MVHSFSASAAVLGASKWQMSYGERAAFVGLLCDLRPRLAIEIGTAEGGSLAQLAAYSEEVHSFDLVEPEPGAREHGNVTFHTGDSHKLLPELLERLAEEDRNVDFVLVDGDHSAGGVRRDMEDLFNSPAVSSTVIVMHDTMNEEVRRGLEEVAYGAWPKVAYVELDFVAGYLFRQPDLRNELWGGLGIVVVDAARGAYFADGPRQVRYHEAHHLVRHMRDELVRADADDAAEITPALAAMSRRHDEEVAELQRRVEDLGDQLYGSNAALASVEQSVSWRLTKPLRAAKRRASRALS
jgi:hypothetical protein